MKELTYQFETNEEFKISSENYIPGLKEYESDYEHFWPCHFGIFIGEGCYYVTVPQLCKRFYNIYATPEDRITQNTPDGYIEFSKFYDRFYSSIDDPTFMYHYDSIHKIFYIIKKVYLKHSNNGQGGGNSNPWRWPRFYIISLPRFVDGKLVCLGQQYNEGCLDATNNQVVFSKFITTSMDDNNYKAPNVTKQEVRVTLPNNDFIKCYTSDNPSRDFMNEKGLNKYNIEPINRLKNYQFLKKKPTK